MGKFLRKSGIDSIGDIHWGSRLCMFYRGEDELMDIILPYFKAGLKNNEFCLWITSSPILKEAAENALRKYSSDLDKHLEKGQIEIIPYTEWYLINGSFEYLQTLKNWDAKLKQAADNGFEGLRAAFNLSWLDKKDRQRFKEFEASDEDTLNKKLSICTYPVQNYSTLEIIDIVNIHDITLFKRNGRWDAIKKKDERATQEALEKRVKELRCLYDITRIQGTTDFSLKKRYFKTVKILPQSLPHPEIAFSRIVINGEEYKTDNYSDSNQKITADIVVHGEKAGIVEIGYIKTSPSAENNHFIQEEKLLIGAIADQLGKITEHYQAGEVLRESEEKFFKAFHSVPDMITIATLKDGKLIEANQSYTRLTGYSRKEMIGRSALELDIWTSIKDRNKMVRILKEKGRVHNEKFKFRTKTGELLDVLVSAEKIDINGKPCVLAVATDVTEKRQSQEIFKSISQNSPLGIYIMQDDKIKYNNPYFRKITGFNQPELSGMELLSLVALEDKDVVKASTISMLKGSDPFPCEYRILNKKGQIKWVMQTASSIRYMSRPAILGNIMDITERKNLERKVIEYEELNRMKSNLISTVSHELRTPLATIKGYATMILDYFPQLSIAEKREYIKSIDSSSDRLTKIIEDLLETSRLESGLLKLKKSPTSLVRLIKDITDETHKKVNHHVFTISLDKRLPVVSIDATRIGQVLDNLIDNAIKYSPEGTEILISGTKYGRELVIGVTDHGPGIPADELTKIFDRMFQSEDKQYSGKDGIGLGLYICRRLVEAHGGTIWAESTPGKGSTIKFTLPLADKIKRKK